MVDGESNEPEHVGLPVIRPGRQVTRPRDVVTPDIPPSYAWARVRTARHRARGSVSTTPPDYVPKRRADVDPE